MWYCDPENREDDRLREPFCQMGSRLNLLGMMATSTWKLMKWWKRICRGNIRNNILHWDWYYRNSVKETNSQQQNRRTVAVLWNGALYWTMRNSDLRFPHHFLYKIQWGCTQEEGRSGISRAQPRSWLVRIWILGAVCRLYVYLNFICLPPVQHNVQLSTTCKAASGTAFMTSVIASRSYYSWFIRFIRLKNANYICASRDQFHFTGLGRKITVHTFCPGLKAVPPL